MAEAFHAALTAIYVKTERYDALSDADKARLQKNTRLAEQNGAFVATVIGNDVAVQIAEYAHISGTTKIVVGRSGTKRQHVWSKASLTEQIILNAPGLDVYIIPDSAVDLKKQTSQFRLPDQIRLTWKDSLVTLLNDNPNVTIELSAHADYRGSAAYNKRLTQRRAENVVRYLIEHGIAADRLTPVGYGEDKPKKIRKKLTEKHPFLKADDILTEEYIKTLKDEEQEICNQLNRRTEFIVLRTTYGLFDKKKEEQTPKAPDRQ